MRVLQNGRERILVAAVVISLLVMAVVGVLIVQTLRGTPSQFSDAELAANMANIVNEFTEIEAVLVMQVNELSHRESIIANTAAGDREALLQLFDQYQVAHKNHRFLTVSDAEGKVIARTANPSKFGDTLEFLTSLHNALEGAEPVAYVESTPGIPLAIRAAAPIRDNAGKIIGTISGGYRLDGEKWVDDLKAKTGLEYTVFTGDVRVGTTLINPQTGTRQLGTKLTNPLACKYVFELQKELSARLDVLGRPLQAVYHPLIGADGQTVGVVFCARFLGENEDQKWRSIINMVLAATAGLLLLWAIMAVLIRQRCAVKYVTDDNEDDESR